MSQQLSKRMIDKVKFKVLSRTDEQFNLKGSYNVRLHIKITYNNKSYSFDWHDSVSNRDQGIESSKEDILDHLCDNYFYHDYTIEQIQDEFACEYHTAKAILDEAKSISRLFNESEIEQLKLSVNGEDFETETIDNKFNDDDPLWSEDEIKKYKAMGLDMTNKKDEYGIELIPKRIKENMFLLGETKDGDRVWLNRGSWDCGWYYGFGYLQEYNKGSWSSHSHFDKFGEEKNIRDGLLDYFKEGKLVITSKQTWILCDLMRSFYTLKDSFEVYHSGSSHLTSVPQLNLRDEVLENKIKADIRRIIIEVQKILSPDIKEAERIKDE